MRELLHRSSGQICCMKFCFLCKQSTLFKIIVEGNHPIYIVDDDTDDKEIIEALWDELLFSNELNIFIIDIDFESFIRKFEVVLRKNDTRRIRNIQLFKSSIW